MDSAAQTPPDDDPAARFRKPAEPRPQAPAEEPAPVRPQSLTRCLEESLIAPFRLGGLFDELAGEPAPGFGLLALTIAVYWCAAFALNLLHFAIVNPNLMQFSQASLALAGGACVLAILLGGFLAAALVEAAALASGAPSDFARSYQIVALLSALAPVQAAVTWLPSAWPAPLLWGGVACAAALERLHRAPAAGARLVAAVLTAGALIGAWTARGAVERLAVRTEVLEQSAAQIKDMAAQVRELQKASEAALPGAAAAGQPAAPGPAAAPGPTPVSSLDLLRAGTPAQSLPSAQAAAAQQSAIGLLNSVQPALNDPAMLKNLPPAQAAMLRQMTGVLAQLQGSLQNGQKLDPQQQLAQINQIFSSLSKSMPVSPQQQAQLNQLRAQFQATMQNSKSMTPAQQQRMMQQMMQSMGPQGQQDRQAPEPTK